MKKNKHAAASYQLLVFSPKYGQIDKVKPPDANHGLSYFVVSWPKLDLKVSIIVCITLLASPNKLAGYHCQCKLILVKNMMLTIVNKFINKGQGLSPL